MDLIEILRSRLPCNLNDATDLIQGGRAREERTVQVELSYNTTYTPHVHFVGVTRRTQEDLRSTIPTSCDVVRHHTLVMLIILSDVTDKREITKFDKTVSVNENVAWLDISMD